MDELLAGNKNSTGSFNLSNSNVLVSFTLPELNIDGVTGSPISFVVGLIQQLTLMQQRQVLRIFEYGNKHYQMVPGKVHANLQMSRVLFDGPSLMKYHAYAYSPDIRDSQGNLPSRNKPNKNVYDHFSSNNKEYNEQYEALVERTGEKMGYKNILSGYKNDNSGWGKTPEHEIPGTSDMWMNLSSKLFENPIGIILEIKQEVPNGDKIPYGGIFLENCIISSHTLITQANQRLLAENVSFEIGRVIPLNYYTGGNIIKIENANKNIF